MEPPTTDQPQSEVYDHFAEWGQEQGLSEESFNRENIEAMVSPTARCLLDSASAVVCFLYWISAALLGYLGQFLVEILYILSEVCFRAAALLEVLMRVRHARSARTPPVRSTRRDVFPTPTREMQLDRSMADETEIDDVSMMGESVVNESNAGESDTESEAFGFHIEQKQRRDYESRVKNACSRLKLKQQKGREAINALRAQRKKEGKKVR